MAMQLTMIFCSKKIRMLLFFILFLDIYILAQFFLGSNSLLSYNKLKMELIKRDMILSQKKTQNALSQRKLKMLTSNIDIDYIDETARRLLYHSDPREKILLIKDGSKKLN